MTWVHPRLGVAALAERWDPATLDGYETIDVTGKRQTEYATTAPHVGLAPDGAALSIGGQAPMDTPIRVSLTDEEAAIVVAAIRYWHDDFLEPEEGQEATHLYLRAERIEAKFIRALKRRGLEMAR